MSRRFNGTSDYLEHGAAVVGAVPITMACWFYLPTSLAVTHSLITIGDSAASTRVQLYVTASSKVIVAQTTNVAASVNAVAQTVSQTIHGIWQHACGIYASAIDRRVFLNGAGKATNATSSVLGTLTTTTIGARYFGGALGAFTNGLIAEAAIWNVALEDWEVDLLSRGYYPDQIRPGNLVSYWPLIGQYSPDEIDRKGRFDATVFGAKPAIFNHPPMIPRTGRRRVLDFAVLPSAPLDMVPARRQSSQQAVNRASSR